MGNDINQGPDFIWGSVGKREESTQDGISLAGEGD